eukprot:TRINITY_DN113572_c0_g1_i1.p1 TRINITY_DN113572_c0_g1~~TRINITY_DN113572_c0_g1_i1.p1  ORF type:complete len:905 (-),score=245.06 TRINITY_DN113572_c0_g1_i1:77-2791(-)
MSSDQQLLAALAMKTKEDLRYFELVTAVCGQDRRRCFLCLGKHAVFFVRQDVNSLIHTGARLFYSVIIKVIQDKNSSRHLLLVLNENRPEEWKSDRLFLQSDHRAMLLKHLQVNWQTDHMWRLGRVEGLPIFRHAVTNVDQLSDPPNVDAFIGFHWKRHQHYRFMVPYEFEDRPNSVQHENTGEFIDPKTGITIVVQVHEPLTLDQLRLLKRDHIRWVAAEYKAELIKEESQFYLLRNAPYQKRMNLAGDLAAWHGWEIILRTRTATLICMLLRRQYCPPVCNNAQDMAVIVRCPADESGQVADFPRTLHVAHLAADSLSAEANTLGVYPNMVQAKLDALRYDEEGFEWVASHLKLRPKWRRDAKIFLRSIIRWFKDDNALKDAEFFLDAEPQEVLAMPIPGEEWASLEGEELLGQMELINFIRDMGLKGDGLPPPKGLTIAQHGQESGASHENAKRNHAHDEETRHRWHQRVARYFAWAVDGGLLGPKFNLTVLFENQTGLTEKNLKNVMYAVHFMLHLRPRVMTLPWAELGIRQLTKESKLGNFMMNDRVMYAILCTEYLRKLLGRQFDKEYYACLASLMFAVDSMNLKAYICRLLMELKASKSSAEDQETSCIVVKPLVTVMENTSPNGLFLATYACAALVNLCSDQEKVKKLLMASGVSKAAVRLLKTKDDDLVHYSLMLIANLTKEVHYRSIFANNGLLPILYDLLTSSYHLIDHAVPATTAVSSAGGNVVSSATKQSILVQVCIVIGQFCNDVAFQDAFVDKNIYSHTVDCILYMYDHCRPAVPLASKCLFALKQLCAHRADLKVKIGVQVIKKLVTEELANKEINKDADFLTQAVLLLQMLSGTSTNCERMISCGTMDTLRNETNTHPLAKKIDGFQNRIANLVSVIHQTTAEEMLV